MKKRSTKQNGVVSTDPVTKLTMTSVEIAERVGKRHCDVMRSIRTMEPAWAKISLRKFASSTYKDERGSNNLAIFSTTTNVCISLPSSTTKPVQSWFFVGLNWKKKPAPRLPKIRLTPFRHLLR